MSQKSTTDQPKITFAVDGYTTFRGHSMVSSQNILSLFTYVSLCEQGVKKPFQVSPIGFPRKVSLVLLSSKNAP